MSGSFPVRPPLPFVPRAVGRAALAELSRIAWDTLAHAYGEGPTDGQAHTDVAGSLAALDTEDAEATEEALDMLWSSVCHQGTIYEATASAVPFLAALAADPNLDPTTLTGTVTPRPTSRDGPPQR